MVTTKGNIVGVTECRFEPLHKGHVYMVHMARGLLREKAHARGSDDYTLHVIVTSHDGEIIPGDTRYMWAQKTFGGDSHIEVHWAHNSLEALGLGNDYAGETYCADWNFWGQVATQMCSLGESVDSFFGSESYVEGIAKACGAEPFEIDEGREAIRLSGTIMRSNSYRLWDKLPDAVKPYFAKKICVTGAPYTGKAKLVRQLAQDFNTVHVADQSGKVYNSLERECTRDDLEKIAMLHTVTADALIEQANRVIISDSDALLTRLWYEHIFGEVPARIKELSDVRRFDLYLLTDSSNLNFRPSNTFTNERDWHAFTGSVKDALDSRGWRYIVLDNALVARRHTNATVAIENLKWETKGPSKMSWILQE